MLKWSTPTMAKPIVVHRAKSSRTRESQPAPVHIFSLPKTSATAAAAAALASIDPRSSPQQPPSRPSNHHPDPTTTAPSSSPAPPPPLTEADAIFARHRRHPSVVVLLSRLERLV